MRIQVFGPGCARCRDAEGIIREVVSGKGLDVDVEHVSDLGAMMDAGVLITPAVVIDGRKVMEGRVPSREDVLRWVAGGGTA